MADWKSYQRDSRADDYCSCGAGADMHIEYVPKLILGIVGVLILGASGVGSRYRRAGNGAGLWMLFLAGALVLLAVAIYAHIKCNNCRKNVRTSETDRGPMLAAIRIGSLAGSAGLGTLLYLAFNDLL